MTWRFLNTGFNTGTFNMAYDLCLSKELKNGTGESTLRVYGWQPWAISIGRNQNIEDLNITKLQDVRIDIVRRPTGGRAILHADELTYSVVTHTHGKSPRGIYRFINEGLLYGLRLLGIEAQLSDHSDNFPKLYKDPLSVPCFTSSAKCEIQYQGKKLVGSAQRRYGSTILQHGSVLLGPRHRELVKFLSEDFQAFNCAIENHLNNRTTDIQSILGRVVSFDETAECIKQGFTLACGINLIEESILAPVPQ